jgi:hypothetical protein
MDEESSTIRMPLALITAVPHVPGSLQPSDEVSAFDRQLADVHQHLPRRNPVSNSRTSN